MFLFNLLLSLLLYIEQRSLSMAVESDCRNNLYSFWMWAVLAECGLSSSDWDKSEALCCIGWALDWRCLYLGCAEDSYWPTSVWYIVTRDMELFCFSVKGCGFENYTSGCSNSVVCQRVQSLLQLSTSQLLIALT